MQDIEPYYLWRDDYIASEDKQSPFYKQTYSEFNFENKIYNYYIHPQWDAFGSPTLYLKIIYTDYEAGYTIIELIGEWNDCINNDIMFLKREVLEVLIESGITRFILIGENILNFHGSDDCYYEEWFQEIEDGWIVGINFREHVQEEFKTTNLDYYINFGGMLDEFNWRKLKPAQLFNAVESLVVKRLN